MPWSFYYNDKFVHLNHKIITYISEAWVKNGQCHFLVKMSYMANHIQFYTLFLVVKGRISIIVIVRFEKTNVVRKTTIAISKRAKQTSAVIN